jgi:hypothetical protein
MPLRAEYDWFLDAKAVLDFNKALGGLPGNPTTVVSIDTEDAGGMRTAGGAKDGIVGAASAAGLWVVAPLNAGSDAD